MSKLTSEEREIVVNALVEHAEFNENDLEEMSDATLIRLGHDYLVGNSDDSEDEDSEEDLEDSEEDIVDNADDDDDFDDDDFDDDEEDSDDEEIVENAECTCNSCGGYMKGRKKKKPVMNAAEWLDSAPPEIQEIVMNGGRIVENEKAGLIERLTANVSGAKKREIASRLANNSLSELQNLVELIPEAPQRTVTNIPGLGQRISYAGAATPTNNKGKAQPSEPLIPPTMNWGEIAKNLATE